MRVFNRIGMTLLAAVVIALLCAGCGEEADSTSRTANSNSPPSDKSEYNEQEIGQEAFEEMKAKVAVIKSSPLYDNLRPVAESVTRAAQSRYKYPFKFYLVHDAQANAFSVPGGNIYVTDSLLYSVKNNEELAGILCHEAAHTINRDSLDMMEKREENWRKQIAADLLFGKSAGRVLAIAFLSHLDTLGYSREVEERADLNGADICAEAGQNPWGLIWFFREFENADKEHMPEMFSDHPDGKSRIKALEKHFQKNPSVFGKFNQDRKSGTAFSVPEDASVVFLR
jgi:beta-barrel assembly-enhancing protease